MRGGETLADRVHDRETSLANAGRKAAVAIVVVIWLVFAGGFGAKLLKPVITYDGMIYTGMVAAPDSSDSEAVRAVARTELQRNMAYAERDFFAETRPYGATVLHTPAYFKRDFAFYQLKFGYVGLARLISLTGLDALSSLRAVSLLSLIVLMVVPLALIAKHQAWPVLIVLPAIWVGAGLREAVLIVTPDLAGAAIGVLLVAGWVYGSVAIAVGAFAISAIMRPEAFILSFGILLASLVLRTSRKMAALCFAATFCVYIYGQLAFDYPGWWQHVSMSLYSPDEVALGAPPLTVESFLGPAIGAWLKMFANFWVWALIAMAAAYLSLAPAKTKFDRQLDVIFWGALAGVIGRAIIFPIPEVRIQFPSVVMLSLILALRADVRLAMERLSQRIGRSLAFARSWGVRPKA